MNLGPLHWEHRVLAPDPPGKVPLLTLNGQGVSNVEIKYFKIC